MSRELSEVQLAELAAFVRKLLDRSKFPTQAEFARAAGYPAPNLSNLLNAKTGIDGYNLMKLIYASELSLEETAALITPRAVTTRHLSEIREEVLRTARLQDELVQLVRRLLPE